MRNFIASLLLISNIMGCKNTVQESEFKKTISTSDAERSNHIKTMKIWQDVDTSKLDLFHGPKNTFKWGQTIYCTFKEPEKGDFGGGKNPKFKCKDNKTGKTYKVKYGLRNAEVYGEVAFARLMYGLGFFHDHYFPVRVECTNCPKDPWEYIKNPNDSDNQPGGGVRLFIPALVEEKIKGDKIENHENQGVRWSEFTDYSGLSVEDKTVRDAFLLLMSFVQHADSKPDQQRLNCTDRNKNEAQGEQTCFETSFLVHDGGWSFGAGLAPGPVGNSHRQFRRKMHLDFWKSAPVFGNKKTCRTGVKKLPNSEFRNVEISEDGRAFLAKRLNLLSDQQISDIFRASRVDLREYVINNTPHDETIEKWTKAFKEKRDIINNTTCPRKLMRL